jgi:uncharacterized protein (TIGR01777 family)
LKILITGGSGLVGSALRSKLSSLGHNVYTLTRSSNTRAGEYHWDIGKGYIDPAALKNTEVIVHLAGASVADRLWTRKRKEVILNSRVDSAAFLLKQLKSNHGSLKHFISASGTGYYGSNENQLDEGSPLGTSFLSSVCEAWEKVAMDYKFIGAEVSVVRIGIVLSKDGGFLGKLGPMTGKGFGAVLGNGNQMMSWIHIDDLVKIFTSLILEEIESGIYNGVAPEPVTHRAMMKGLAKAQHSRIYLPAVPAFVLKLVLGELSSELLANQNILPARLEKQKFMYKYPRLEDALKAVYS